MEKIILAVKPRDANTKAKHLRKQGLIPGEIYGHGVKNLSVRVKSSDLGKVYRQVGTSTLVELDLPAQAGLSKDKRTVLIQDVDRDPVTDRIIHVDFHQVKLDEKIKTEIPLKFVGTAPAVKELEGTLLTNKDHLNVEALPQDLVHEIEVDISKLKTFEDTVHIKDIPIPQGITILDNTDELVVTVQAPRSEEELAALEEEVKEDVEAVKVEEKGKVEEEAVEGEAAAEPIEPARPAGRQPTAEGSRKEEK